MLNNDQHIAVLSTAIGLEAKCPDKYDAFLVYSFLLYCAEYTEQAQAHSMHLYGKSFRQLNGAEKDVVLDLTTNGE